MGTLICRVELNKKNGITLTVENKDGKITQTVLMDGTSIILTNKSQEDTSKITQKSGSIAIECKSFTLDAETITLKSTKDTKHESGQKFDIQSAQDMTLKSSATITEKATGDFNVSGANVKLSGSGKAELSGANITVNGSAKTEIKGATLSLSGSATTELKGGASVKISSSGMMNVEGSLTTVKGQMTNIQGNLVKLG